MNEPKLRFKADDGSQFPDWKEKKIGDLFYKVNERNNGQFGKDKWISVAKMYYQDEDKVTSNNIDTRTYVMRIGDMAFEGHPNKEFKYGRFVVNDIGDGIISELFPIYRHKGEYVLKYWKYAIQIDTIMQKIYRKAITSSGASSNKLDNNDFENQSIPVPCLEEQQKIAEFLSTVDTVIEKQKETVSAWEERKKGVMQKLFSQEVRFKADDGSDFPEWEEKKLGDVFTERTERSKGGESLLSVTIAEGIIKQSETDKRNIASENKSNYKIVKKNDLAYNTMRMWQGAEGVSEYDGIVSPAYTVITAVDGNNSYFFETMFKQTFMLQVFQRFSQGLTSDTWNLKFPAFSEIKCQVPCEDEQNKIVECVAVLDDVIEKQKETLAAWEELKKGLLQQMFV